MRLMVAFALLPVVIPLMLFSWFGELCDWAYWRLAEFVSSLP